ncbi:MAG: bacillithiol biosynthesis cysteine-adding enzyme BshC [Gemmatimonadota bacterium]|nr:MAG: bacillithiol biosynthesis cysteine-adding enzyme BshC [Gemmatimonadota bacterium]
MTIAIDRQSLEGSQLFSAYLQDYLSVARFYPAGSPADLGSYRKVLEQIHTSWADSRWQALREVGHVASPAIRARLEELVEEKGVLISTGQQAGLFLGPLYTIYKALTAARLAELLEKSLGVPVMPMFTVASEDHDWGEVDHTYLIDLENQLVRLAVHAPGMDDPQAPSTPVERIPVPSDIEQAVAKLVQVTPNSEFKVSLLDPLRMAYRPGRSFAEAFQDAFESLLGRYGFLVQRTASPYVKRATRELLWSEWRRRHQSSERLLRRSAELKAADFAEQVAVTEKSTNLFYDGPLGRDRILMEDGEGRLRRAGDRLSELELRAALEGSPERVSPGALLRPVTEAHAFPVVAYVGGPAEIAYLAQSQVLFELHGVPSPVIVPRNAFLLIEPKVARVLEKYEMAPTDLAGDPRAMVNRQLEERTPPTLRDSLARLREMVTAGLGAVEEAALEFDPGSTGTVGKSAKAVQQSIDALEAKLQARVRERHDIMKQQLLKAALNLYPEGRPQERVLNAYPFLVRYGEALLDDIYSLVRTPLG